MMNVFEADKTIVGSSILAAIESFSYAPEILTVPAYIVRVL